MIIIDFYRLLFLIYYYRLQIW